MYKLIKFYNIYRKTIWKVILGIALLIITLQILNYNVIKESEEYLNNYITSNQTNENIVDNTYNSVNSVISNSAISGTSLSTRQEKYSEIIDNFYNYCKNGQVEEAYNLLTEECKEEMYTTLDLFDQYYYKIIFGETEKTIEIQNWFGATYKVDINDNPLVTGTYNTDNTIQEYVTVEEVSDDEYRLNINNYVGRKSLDIVETQENITISILEKNTYMDYESYTIKIFNGSENTIMIDDLTDTKSMYIEDDNGLEYNSYSHELYESKVTLEAYRTTTLEIKYYSKYTSTKDIENLVFSRIVLNKDNQNNEFYKFKIEL